MIKTKTELRDWLDYERRKYGIRGGVRGSLVYAAKLFFGSEPAVLWHFQKRLRITEYHMNAGHKFRYIVSRARLNRLRNKYGLNISVNVFGRGLRIMHIGPLLTNGNTRVGADCSLHTQVALVAGGTTDEAPVLGDNIVLGVGATVLGGVHLADGIAVGAGAVVNKSFDEEGIAIAGVPARKISDNGRAAWAGAKREKKINVNLCIITVYNSENCGSFLQAYALYSVLRLEGHRVFFLKRKNKMRTIGNHLIECCKRLVKGRFREIPREWIKYRNFIIAQKKFKIISGKKDLQQIDCFVIGSDTVWNFSSEYFLKKKKIYLGTLYREKKRISYAASVGNTDYNILLNDDEIKNGLKNLDRISVRDEYSKKIVDLITGKESVEVIDPTMLVDFSFFEGIESERSEENYILLYYFGKISVQLRDKINSIAKSTNKKIISLGQYYSWADVNAVYDPFDLLYLFHHADAVITNTFHGTIFSILYHKRFVDLGGNKNKITNLLAKLKIEGQLCTEADDLLALLTQEIDYKSVDEITYRLRDESLSYLREALKENS